MFPREKESTDRKINHNKIKQRDKIKRLRNRVYRFTLTNLIN